MHALLHNPDFSAARTLREAIASVRQLEAAGAGSRVVVGYGPVARLNPFQALLYSAFPAEGLAVCPVYDITTMPALTAMRREGYESVFHLHWTAQILRDAADEADAGHRADTFLEVVDDFVTAGGKLMWTVHNVLPHDVVFRAQQTRLQRELIERCWRVHVMSHDTRDRVAEVCPIPTEKVVYSPHPAYDDAYPSYWTREEARATLGIEPGEIVLATFGAIKAYKGIARVLEVLDESWTHDAPWRLVLAGPPDRDPQTRELLSRAARHPRVILNAGKVRAEDVQIFLRAADVALVPYERSLNSGYLLLALTFGLPVIAPDGGGPRDVVTAGTGLLFDPSSRDDLARRLRELPVLLGPEVRQAARERAGRFEARLVSAELARQLLKDINH